MSPGERRRHEAKLKSQREAKQPKKKIMPSSKKLSSFDVDSKGLNQTNQSIHNSTNARPTSKQQLTSQKRSHPSTDLTYV